MVILAIYLYITFIGITLPLTIVVIILFVVGIIYSLVKDKIDKKKQAKIDEKNKIVNQQWIKKIKLFIQIMKLMKNCIVISMKLKEMTKIRTITSLIEILCHMAALMPF